MNDDGVNLAFAGVAISGLIVGLLQVAKRFFPTAHSNIWLGASLFLGIVGQTAVYVAQLGVPDSFQAWLTLLILGLAFGLSASKAYDETVKPRT
jgi:hypothetical protein